MIERVGLIGLGTMGQPMAHNLLRHGFSVVGYDVDPQAVKILCSRGGVPASSPAVVASESDVVITMLPTPQSVQDAFLGESGIRHGIHPGLIAIDMSTNDVGVVQHLAHALAALDVPMLDCPVGRTEQHAIAGTLLILAGGPRDVVDQCRPVLMAMGEEIVYCGPIGMGQTTKLLNNLLANLITWANAEVLTVGVKSGLSVKHMTEVFSRTGAGSNQLTGYLQDKVLKGDVAAGFRMTLAQKDHGLALDLAKQVGVPVLASALCYQMLVGAVAAGYGAYDVTALVDRVGESAGVRVRAD